MQGVSIGRIHHGWSSLYTRIAWRRPTWSPVGTEYFQATRVPPQLSVSFTPQVAHGNRRVTGNMATIDEVTVGSYYVDVRVHQVVPTQLGHFDLRDLTPYFIQDGCQIERDNCASMDHATARLSFSFTDEQVLEVFGVPEVPWSSMRLRPSMRLVSHDGLGETDWYNLGVFFPETPIRRADQQPKVYDVDCHDIISAIAEPTGGTIFIPGGETVQTAIEGLFNLRSPGGDLQLLANVPRAFPRQIVGTVPSDRQWVIDENTTWLLVIDRLLEMVGWRPPWVDSDGNLTSDRWVDPRLLPIDITLNDLPSASVITLGTSNKLDTFGVPNHWVFIRNDFDPEVSGAPSLEDGIVVRNNLDAGPSSQQARQRIVSSVQRVDVADQTSLELYADRVVLQDTIPSANLCLDIAPRPLPWHRGIASVTIRELGIVEDIFLISSWTLPLDGADAKLVMDGIQ